MFEIKFLFVQFLYCSFFFPSLFADFNYKIGPCTFDYRQKKCGLDQTDGEKLTPSLKGYYWRPYVNGIIPGDAYPISKGTQTPRTFMGLVYDPSREGTVIITIVEGIKSVKSIDRNGEPNELNDNIKILCTQEPDKFYWYNVSDPNRPPSRDFIFLKDSVVYLFNQKRSVSPFATITWNCRTSYASSVVSLTDPSEFVSLDGTVKSSRTYVFLAFSRKESDDKKDNKKIKRHSFISHQYKYAIKSDSIIPNYYKLLRIGSFSMLCTNEIGKTGSSSKVVPDYFWTSKDFFSKEIALPFGDNGNGNTFYAAEVVEIGQFGVDLGTTSDGQNAFVYLPQYNNINIHSLGVLTLGTLNPKDFSWVPTTSQEFPTMNTKNLIRGGYFPNGTKIYVGRAYDTGHTYPASIKKLESSAYASYADTNAIFGTTNKFDVLYYKGSE